MVDRDFAVGPYRFNNHQKHGIVRADGCCAGPAPLFHTTGKCWPLVQRCHGEASPRSAYFFPVNDNRVNDLQVVENERGFYHKNPT